ncbi:MAG: hypothetical protein JWR05_662 [Mucilaginibacter sp.]|nr:hypothetical protein [Mucilaginibacter sp.]
MTISLPGDVTTDPNFSFSDFSDVNSPIKGDPTPLINNGTTIELLSYLQQSSGRLIGHITPRGNTEDMTFGTSVSTNGIKPEMINLSDWDLFNGVTEMFHKFTYFDGGLTTVGDQMIQKFKDKTGGTFENAVLNARVGASSELQNFAINFGGQLNAQLKANGGNIGSIGTLDLSSSIRPIFNGIFNKFHGLQILLNDTESTDVQLDEFNGPVGGYWSATITLTIKDHFGLDRHDAITYQGYMSGFAGWWLLQHKRGYVPFETVVHVKYRITGNIN